MIRTWIVGAQGTCLVLRTKNTLDKISGNIKKQKNSIITVVWAIYRGRFRDHLVRFCGKASGVDFPVVRVYANNNSAIRSPITTAGMFVLARGICGISETSPTVTLFSPCTAPLASHTLSSPAPIGQVPTG